MNEEQKTRLLLSMKLTAAALGAGRKARLIARWK